MIPFCDCTSGGLQLREMVSDVVASTFKSSGGMLGAAVRNCKRRIFMIKYKQETRNMYMTMQLTDCNPNSKKKTFLIIAFLNYELNTCYLSMQTRILSV